MVSDDTNDYSSECDMEFWAKRFDIVNAAAQHMFYDYNLNADCIKWFGAVMEVLGYNVSELDGSVQKWIDMLAPEESSWVITQLEKSCRCGEPFDLEYRMRRKDGQYIHVHDSGIFQRDDVGRPFQMLGIIQDVQR